MRRSGLWISSVCLTLAGVGCHRTHDDPAPVVIHAGDVDPGQEPALEDLRGDLSRLTGGEVGRTGLPDPGCTDGKIRVVYLGTGSDPRSPSLASQQYSITEERCKTGRRYVISGGSSLAAQWGVYDFLRQLGVRYWHPEQTFYPDDFEWPERRLDTIGAPRFRQRSMHAHRTHPIELSAPLFYGDLDMAGYQRRWVDWNVKLRQTEVDGWDSDLLQTYAYDRGFPRTTGFNLLNSQQGGRPILDPDDPRPEDQQIAEAIDERMAPIDGLPDPVEFGFQFNPSEFTEADDTATVKRLRFITDYVHANYPGTRVTTINHGTAQEPTPRYGVRFFDLPQFAPPDLGVKVHTLMFYDLERPAAGVYGNDSFAHLLDWTLTEQEKRRIVHYPEGSWWLTFDLPVPLYLAPVTLEAREHDIELLSPYLSKSDDAATGVYGHHLFTSGQEWGYWLIDYCVARMTWDLSSHRECLADFTERLAAGDEILDVLVAVEERQVEDLRDPDLLRFLVGSDDETETAAAAGIVFHPLPPQPRDVLSFDDEAAAALETRSLAPLEAMAADYHRFADRIEAVLPLQSPAQAPWVREIRDGLRVFALRAEHAVAVYRTALGLRAAIADADLDRIGQLADQVEQVRQITAAAEAVIWRREQDYRYPAELTIDGDEPGTTGAVENKTIYPYRYLSRTHRLFYWHRPDEQLAALFGDGLELVQVERRILRLGESLSVSLLANEIGSLQIDWGDGQIETALEPHAYAAQGVYDWVLDATADGAAIHEDDRAAVVSDRFVFAKGDLEVVEPSGASVIEGLIPGFVIGLGDDGSPFLALGRIDDSGDVAAQGSVQRRDRQGQTSGPADLALDLAGVGSLTIYGAVIEVTPDPSGSAELDVSGEISTDEVIALLVSVGGFDEEGARKLIADVLGYTVDTLPERVSFVVAGPGASL